MVKPEEKARQVIDSLLVAAGWIIQNLNELNLGVGLGVAVREFPLKAGAADYLLFLYRKAVGVVEAKVLINQWRREYNQIRPHSAKNYQPPAPEAILIGTTT